MQIGTYLVVTLILNVPTPYLISLPNYLIVKPLR